MQNQHPSRPLVSIPLIAQLGDREKLRQALAELRHRNPILRIKGNPDAGQITIEDRSEFHLEEICRCLQSEYGIEFEIGDPAVLFIETIREPAEGEGKYIRQTGGRGNYGHAKIRLDPSEPGIEFQFRNEIRGGVVPKEYIGSIQEGIRDAAHGGIIAGYEVVGFKATLCDGSYHDVDSNEMAFRIAGSLAFKEAARKARPVLLEPIMLVEITFPEERMSAIVADLNHRRGRIADLAPTIRSHRGRNLRVIQALVPLKEILGYAPDLQLLTQGGASHTMDFAHYEPVRPGGMSEDDNTGQAASKPQGPRPRDGSAAADPESDWT